MVKIFTLLVTTFAFLTTAHSQGVQLLYKGGGTGTWNNPLSWIQVNAPAGQTPVQRVPTQFDDLIFSRAHSGLSSAGFAFNPGDSIEVGGNSTSGYRCRSMQISNMSIAFYPPTPYLTFLHIYTANGGNVIIDSGSDVTRGHFMLHGGNPAINDLEIRNSNFGVLFSHASWATIGIKPDGKARFENSTFGGRSFGGESDRGSIYAENCVFRTNNFNMGDNSTVTLLNTNFLNDLNNPSMSFTLGHNAIVNTTNVDIKSQRTLGFYTSGAVFNGNVSIVGEHSGSFTFGQKYPANPKPNIINGNFFFHQNSMGIKGDLKISGNLVNNSPELFIYPDTAHVFINGQFIFKIGGLTNYRNSTAINNCSQDLCHFKLEFFGSTNSNIAWPVGVPIDTLIINKTGCAKVTSNNSLYVSGEARIQSGQLVLNPNAGIPYKFVCAGNLKISAGAGVFLRKNSVGQVAGLAVDGDITDQNTVVDSTCTGLSNPYAGNVTMYLVNPGAGNHTINLAGNANIGNLNLSTNASDFVLGSHLTVNNLDFGRVNRVVLGQHNITVTGNILNGGADRYFVTDGSGSVRINNIGLTPRTFPVGPSRASYNPVSMVNTGIADQFSVNVVSRVLSLGDSGTAYTTGAVNRTWNIREATAGGSNVAMTLQWDAADEMPGFNRSTAYLAHHSAGSWSMGPLLSSQGTTPYSVTRGNFTSFSPFTILGPAGPLSTTVIDFSAVYRQEKVDITWSTSSEFKTKYFIVERSGDKSVFGPIKTLPAAGYAQEKTDYSFTDVNWLPGVSYYRLQIVQEDGSVRYSDIVTVTAPSDVSFSVYPNPVKEKLLIKIQGNTVDVNILLVDARGAMVKQVTIVAGTGNQLTLPVADLPAGIYTLQVSVGNVVKTRQISKH